MGSCTRTVRKFTSSAISSTSSMTISKNLWMMNKSLSVLTLILTLMIPVQANYTPRKLTQAEVQNKEELQLDTILSPSDNTTKEDTSNHSVDPIKDLPKGTNTEGGAKDAIRMPGTYWCGKGWRADSAKSMGGYAGADRCCRHHDLGCPISIEPGQTKYGLTNVRIRTVMHCSCDERFRSCLKMARTQAADIVGNLFFNVADIPCFVFSKAKVCSSRSWWGRCSSNESTPAAVWKKNPT